MSVSTLNKNVWKTWADLRLQDMTVYGNLTYTPSNVDPFTTVELEMDVTGFNNQPGRTTSVRLSYYDRLIKIYFLDDILVPSAFQVNGQPLILGTLDPEYRPSVVQRFHWRVQTGVILEEVSQFGCVEVRVDGTIQIFIDPIGFVPFSNQINEAGAVGGFSCVYLLDVAPLYFYKQDIVVDDAVLRENYDIENSLRKEKYSRYIRYPKNENNNETLGLSQKGSSFLKAPSSDNYRIAPR